MKQNRNKHRSSALGSLHDTAQDLHAVGALSDSKMKQFDESCLLKLKTSKKSGRKQTLKNT